MHSESLLETLTRFPTAELLVLGDVMLDRYAYGTVERISPEAPVPVLKLERSVGAAGGAANVARNGVALGARVTLIGVVGEDAEGAELRAALAENTLLEARLIGDATRPTTTKVRYVADGQQVMRADRETREPLAPETEARVLKEFSQALDRARVVILSDYAKGTLGEQMLRIAIESARAARKTVIVDPKSRDFDRYRGATLITPNQHELQQAVGRACATALEVQEAARGLLERGLCEALVVTRGGQGMSVVRADGLTEHLPTSALQVFDVSGAGDTVIATLALALAVGADVIDAARLANMAAGIVVGKRGTATVSPGELLARLRPHPAETGKVLTRESVMPLVHAWRAQGLRIAFTNGCFDLLHPGHVALLNQARASADRLIVGLNSDASVRRLKGPERPVQSEVARATVLAALAAVDAVVLFEEDTPYELIELVAPDVLVKGADYTRDQVVGADLVTRRGGHVLLVPLLERHSTSDTLRRARRGAANRDP